MKINKYVIAAGLFGGLLFAAPVNAQSSKSSSDNNSKFFKAWGWSPFLDWMIGPSINEPNGEVARFITYGGDFSYLLRYNLSESNNNKSIGISGIPTIGLGGGITGGSSYGSGYLSFNLPVVLEYATGNISTYTSDKDAGFVVGVGVEVIKAPLLVSSGSTYTDYYGNTVSTVTYPVPPSFWVEPCIELGYRHWNSNNKAKELNLIVGFGTGGSFSFRLSWFKYIGY